MGCHRYCKRMLAECDDFSIKLKPVALDDFSNLYGVSEAAELVSAAYNPIFTSFAAYLAFQVLHHKCE